MDRVRRDTDEAVLHALIDAPRLTRADLATAVSISKPTASESVRRLTEAGLIVEAGLKEGGRGRVGVYYRLAPDAGLALAVSAGPDGVVAECLDPRGELRHRAERQVGATVSPEALREALTDVITACESAVGHPVPTRVFSVADPVERDAARLVHLSRSPFVTGEAELGDLVGPDGVVDNDVHWAALAEVRAGAAASFVHVYLGPGLGAAVVDAGRIVTGSRGLAGEIGHAVTVGPGGRAVLLLDALEAMGLLVTGGNAVDVPRLRSEWEAGRHRHDLPRVLAGALATVSAMLEPAEVVLDGPWSDLDALDTEVTRALSTLAPHHVILRRCRIPDSSRTGVRHAAVERGISRLVALVPAAGT
ncbi:MAG: ROK family transcriptional regulator [Mobilicoccus sp.]|nr:ROK family transcriptional regulator [Mobilicoccus sp.]